MLPQNIWDNLYSRFGVFLLFLFWFFVFLGPHPWYMEVPGLGGHTASGLCHSHSHSHSHAGSELHLRPTPQLMATLYLWPSARSGIKPASSWILVGFISAAPQRELPVFLNWNRTPGPRLTEVQVLYVSAQKEFSERQSDR